MENAEKDGQTEECPYGCPICAAIGLMKHMNPEVSQHLSVAAREFLLAARAFVETVSDGSSDRPSRVQKIELD